MNKNEKILLVLFGLANGEKVPVNYSDLIVKCFKTYPESFHLKNYREYPDSNMVNKRLYTNLRPNGFIQIANLQIQLTEKGLQKAKKLHSRFSDEGTMIEEDSNEFSNYEKNELSRLVNLKGFHLHLEKEKFKPLDVDVYEFYKSTVRTNKKEMKSRMSQINYILEKAFKKDFQYAQELVDYKSIIDKKYSELIQ